MVHRPSSFWADSTFSNTINADVIRMRARIRIFPSPQTTGKFTTLELFRIPKFTDCPRKEKSLFDNDDDYHYNKN
jgi:hypothetical protein